MSRDIRELLDSLSASDWWDRRKTIQMLLDYPEDRYADFLATALRNHEDANLRNAAMEVYTALGERALPYLVPMLADDDPEVRLFCVNILGDIGSLQGIPHLCRSINDDDENVRIASAESLGKIGDAGAIGVLKKALNQDAWMAMAALHAIGNIGGSPSLEILHSCLSNEPLREFAVAAVELAGDASSFEPLAEVVKTAEDILHRELALKAMVGIAHRKGLPMDPETLAGLVPALLEFAGASDTDIRAAALDALTWASDRRAVPTFIAAVQDESTREQGIEGLLAIGTPAVGDIKKALDGPGAPDRELFASVLCRLGDEDSCLEVSET